MPTAVQTIRLEHFNISSVLYCLRYLLEEVEKGRWAPDFELFSTILDYMERFPQVFHHPKEEDYLFAALRRRKPEIAGTLAKVHEEHLEGARKLKELRLLLKIYQADRGAFALFKEKAEYYIAFERRHMAREERELLPLALRVLQEEDWAAIDAAFVDNDDLLFGSERRKEFEGLIHQILALAPTPLGFQERQPVRV